MKVYNLACSLSHSFEGWFRSEEDFLTQHQKHILSCPVCESTEITRMPSAPYLGSKKSGEEVSPDSNISKEASSIPQDTMHLTSPQKQELQEKMQATVLKVMREIMSNTEDVGESFAEEARKIHYKESPQRSIRGTATVDEAAELIEEGIEVFSLPVSPTIKNTLQ